MQDLLSYIQSGHEVTREVPIFVNRQALVEDNRLETAISRTADKEKLTELQALQDDIREQILESQVTVYITLPDKDKRLDLTKAVMAEFKLTGEEDYAPNVEFYEEITTRNIHLAVTKIDSPQGTEENIDIDAFRAFQKAMENIPANWNSIVEAFNELVSTEVIADMEYRSADFS